MCAECVFAQSVDVSLEKSLQALGVAPSALLAAIDGFAGHRRPFRGRCAGGCAVKDKLLEELV